MVSPSAMFDTPHRVNFVTDNRFKVAELDISRDGEMVSRSAMFDTPHRVNFVVCTR